MREHHRLVYVVAHELGHVLGLEDTGQLGRLMYPIMPHRIAAGRLGWVTDAEVELIEYLHGRRLY
jgi:hypothetical protein